MFDSLLWFVVWFVPLEGARCRIFFHADAPLVRIVLNICWSYRLQNYRPTAVFIKIIVASVALGY